MTRSAWVSESYSARSAAGSSAQKRRRVRRMYQLERSSVYDSNAATTPGVQKRSYASVASRTSIAVRDSSQRSSGCGSPAGADDGSKPAIDAYVTKKTTEFQKVSS